MLTVLTATYNRAFILPKLYSSLCAQTDRDFDWLIVDDGSVDDTEALVHSWIDEGRISITYIKQKNGGKSRAVNRGTLAAKGDFIAIMDSDDYFLSDAVEAINSACRTIAGNGNLAGVFMSQGVMLDDGTVSVNGHFKSKHEYADMHNYQRNCDRFRGDRLEVVRTMLMRKYRYPEFEGEKFVAPSALWNQMDADGYKFRIFKKVVCIIEYLPDGLTKTFYKNRANSYYGYVFATKALVDVSGITKHFWVVWNFAKISKMKKISNKAAAQSIGYNRALYSLIAALAGRTSSPEGVKW